MKKLSGRASGHYSPGVIAGGMLYVSGQLPRIPETGNIAAGGIEAQAQQALLNLEAVLKLGGATRENVVQCRVYVTDIGLWDAVNGVYSAFFGGHKPARAIVPVGALHHGCLIEIEAVAELPQ